VDSVDNLDRALAMVPEEKLNATEKNEHLQDLVSLYDGLKMTESILMQTLKKHGLERFDPSVEGEKFNPNEHEATFMTPGWVSRSTYCTCMNRVGKRRWIFVVNITAPLIGVEGLRAL
jgi:molecular chaperone GrpE (heat shock protein)